MWAFKKWLTNRRIQCRRLFELKRKTFGQINLCFSNNYNKFRNRCKYLKKACLPKTSLRIWQVKLFFSFTTPILILIFILFVSMITLGVAHGLILLPVVLSYIGPTVCISHGAEQLQETHVQSGTGTPTSKEAAEDGEEEGSATRDSGSEDQQTKFVKDCVDQAMAEIDC